MARVRRYRVLQVCAKSALILHEHDVRRRRHRPVPLWVAVAVATVWPRLTLHPRPTRAGKLCRTTASFARVSSCSATTTQRPGSGVRVRVRCAVWLARAGRVRLRVSVRVLHRTPAHASMLQPNCECRSREQVGRGVLDHRQGGPAEPVRLATLQQQRRTLGRQPHNAHSRAGGCFAKLTPHAHFALPVTIRLSKLPKHPKLLSC